jgi:hypothetical protein
MTGDRTIAPRTRQPGPSEAQQPPLTAASPLLEQAKGFAQVAREAANDCQTGEDALKEMQRRRNGSGQ